MAGGATMTVEPRLLRTQAEKDVIDQFGAAHPKFPLLLAVALPLCAIGGLGWGLLTWYFNERIFRALHTSR